MPKPKKRHSPPRCEPVRPAYGAEIERLLPDNAEIEARYKALKARVSFRRDAKKLLEQARIVAQSERITVDEAMGVLRSFLRERQSVELIQAMGLDPNEPDAWREGFMQLAEIHYDVSRLVHRWKPSRKKTKPTREQLSILVAVRERIDRGEANSERDAIWQLAKEGDLPYRPQRLGQGDPGYPGGDPGYPESPDALSSRKPLSESENKREKAYRKRLALANRSVGDLNNSLSRALDVQHFDSNFEALLWLIENKASLSPLPGGDK